MPHIRRHIDLPTIPKAVTLIQEGHLLPLTAYIIACGKPQVRAELVIKQLRTGYTNTSSSPDDE